MTARKELPTFEASTAAQWRSWLSRHHDSVTEVWLIFHKRHTGRPCIEYQDALDEALCFGWIDSLVRRLDEDRYARKFTPRKPESIWSEVNRRHYARLKAEGRLAPPGMARAPTPRRYAPPRKRSTATPAYIERALRKNAKARKEFENLPPHQRRYYIGWIDAAKKEETKQKRLAEALRVLAAGEPLGLK
jgi:uncharacterized protein YdeI (YjbR/CyaY-like superfamily)